MEMVTSSRTKVKAFRLDAKLVASLKRVAQRLQVSENMYVTQVLTRALMIDPLIPAFDGIEVGEETFASIISTSNPDSLEMDGFVLGKKNFSLARDLFESAGYQMTFIQFVVEILGKEGNWFKVEGGATESPGLTLRHKYGEKWSLFLKSYLSGAYESLANEKLQVEVKGNILKIRIPKKVLPS